MGSSASPAPGTSSRTAGWPRAPATRAARAATGAPRAGTAISSLPSAAPPSAWVQYFPGIRAFYRTMSRRKPPMVARARDRSRGREPAMACGRHGGIRTRPPRGCPARPQHRCACAITTPHRAVPRPSQHRLPSCARALEWCQAASTAASRCQACHCATASSRAATLGKAFVGMMKALRLRPVTMT